MRAFPSITPPTPRPLLRGGTTSASSVPTLPCRSGFTPRSRSQRNPNRGIKPLLQRAHLRFRRKPLALIALISAALFATPTARAAEQQQAIFAPENFLHEPSTNPEWRELFTELGKPTNRISTFEERRYFPFREKPIVLQGEIRIAPSRGLSLSYAGSKPYVVIVDETGVLMRDERGRQRSAPDDSRARAVTSALSHILRFDLAALEKEFVIHGLRQDGEWTLGFVPRDPDLTNALGTVVVQGRDSTLTRIEMARPDGQRIEILINQTEADVIFTMNVLQRFFR